MALLAKFLAVREPNLKYLALENMSRLAEVPAVVDTVSRWAGGWRALGEWRAGVAPWHLGVWPPHSS